MYPLHVILTLVGMITAGAGRIVAVKVYFQIELEQSQSTTPLFVTLLYLLGQALSLGVYFAATRLGYIKGSPSDKVDDKLYSAIEMAETHPEDGCDVNNKISPTSSEDDDEMPKAVHQSDDEPCAIVPRPKLRRQGSKTGLTEDSKDAVAWVHKIPWYLKPVIPGFFNLCNSALRWACLVFVAASTAEILISGMELVFSSFAARIIRKRIISKQRWVGVSIVTLGIVLVGLAKLVEKKEIEDEEHRFLIGNMLIFGQCIFSVLQDLSEEIFMQEANFPATLLLGMEGLFGLVFGVPIYLLFFAEDITFSRFNMEYELGLVLLVLVTGVLNIRTTEVTSSMTRNVWKQFRIILVWILGLSVYYVGSGDRLGELRLGEPWVFPGSVFVLGGFSVILTGVYFYYSD